MRMHRAIYSPTAKWYQWQPRKTGRESLFKQNDKQYKKLVGKIPGLHELHIAEETSRFFELTVYYQDENLRVKIDPSIPPMGDPYHFPGTIWRGRKFNQMWEYWAHCYPAHAYDIGRELYQSNKEARLPWWDIKNKATIDRGEPESKRQRIDEGPILMEVESEVSRIQPIRSGGYFERIYMDMPCRICGSYNHPALQEREDEYGDVRYHYVCPIAQEGDWETCYMRPCPVKMAIFFDYNEQEILKAWHMMIEDGWGQHQTSRVLSLFLRMANKAVKEKG